MNLNDLMVAEDLFADFYNPFILKGPLVNGFQDNLMKYKKNDLLEIADILEMEIPKSLNKAEICKRMIANYQDESILASIYINLSDLELLLIETLLNSDQALVGNVKYLAVKFLLDIGFVHLYKFDGDYHFIMSDEMKNLISNIDKDMLSNIRDAQQTVIDYTSAAMNLYGSLPYDRLKSFFMMHMEAINQPLLEEEVLDVLFMGQFVKMHPYYFDGQYFFSQFYSEEDEEVGIQVAENGKPYYLPSYEVFIRYANVGYVEKTYEYKAMEDFIRRHVTTDEVKIDNYMIGLNYICEYLSMNSAVEELEELDYVFKSDQEFHRFAMLYQDYHNNTRMWSNHGYTPSELSGVRPKKVGRNEPCPCGSGKKFKKCCGSPLRSVK